MEFPRNNVDKEMKVRGFALAGPNLTLVLTPAGRFEADLLRRLLELRKEEHDASEAPSPA